MILACAGHFLIDLPLFGGPAILGIVGLGWIVKVERRRAAKTGSMPSDLVGAMTPFASHRSQALGDPSSKRRKSSKAVRDAPGADEDRQPRRALHPKLEPDPPPSSA